MIPRNARDGLLSIRDVGIASGDIPTGSILEDASYIYSSNLLRAYISNGDTSIDVEENGMVNSGAGFTWNLYVDGVFIKTYAYGTSVFRAQLHALVHDVVTAVVQSPRSEVVPEAELEDEQ